MRTRFTLLLLVVAVVAVIAVVGCGGGDGDDGGGDTTAAPTTTTPLPTTAPPAAKTPAARGERLVSEYGCLACHSTTGATRAGPKWNGLAGSIVKLDHGRTVVADRDYLIRSILEPDAQVVEGYVKGIMSAAVRPSSIGRDDAEAMAAYIESLPPEP
jgi:cytochrome c oxidase subunit II